MKTRRALPRIVRAWCAMALACLCAPAFAQNAPAFVTTPAYPPANTPFEATFYYTWNPFALAFSISHPAVAGNTITLYFEDGCGFICPGGNPAYSPYREQMPALPAGTYTVNIVRSGDLMLIATFQIVVGAQAPTEIPASGTFALLAAAALLAFAARRRLAHANGGPRGTADARNINAR